ncbi:hypothetical protein JXQ70_00335 [bacterium]|nr:hypothetical protein [bacterium]
MRKQSIRALIALIFLSFLLGCAVLLYAFFSPNFQYSFASNLESNADYYPDLTR